MSCTIGESARARSEDIKSIPWLRECKSQDCLEACLVLNQPSGINRLTNNLELALPIIEDAFRCALLLFNHIPHSLCLIQLPSRITDEEAVSMSRYLVQHDGLFLGSSSACNLFACVKLVKKMEWVGSGKRLVTILCDSGSRHYSKVCCNPAYRFSAVLTHLDDIFDDSFGMSDTLLRKQMLLT
jgi:hypothetical protein